MTEYLLKIGVLQEQVQFGPKFQVEGIFIHQPFTCQKTRWMCYLHGIRMHSSIGVEMSFVDMSFIWMTHKFLCNSSMDDSSMASSVLLPPICHQMCRSRIALLVHNKSHWWWWNSYPSHWRLSLWYEFWQKFLSFFFTIHAFDKQTDGRRSRD